jgi:hypothetical protein
MDLDLDLVRHGDARSPRSTSHESLQALGEKNSSSSEQHLEVLHLLKSEVSEISGRKSLYPPSLLHAVGIGVPSISPAHAEVLRPHGSPCSCELLSPGGGELSRAPS